MIKIIAALSSNRVIGNNGKIPWFIKGLECLEERTFTGKKRNNI